MSTAVAQVNTSTAADREFEEAWERASRMDYQRVTLKDVARHWFMRGWINGGHAELKSGLSIREIERRSDEIGSF